MSTEKNSHLLQVKTFTVKSLTTVVNNVNNIFYMEYKYID
jgi:hypothetical protein